MTKTPIPCYYPGEFIVPNKYDLQIAYWLARKSNEVQTLTIVIGKDDNKSIPGTLKEEIWNAMLNATGGEMISVHRSDKYSPLTYIYKKHERDTMSPFALGLDRATAEDKNFQETFDTYPNYEIILLPRPPKDTLAQEMYTAIKQDDFKTFSAGLPPELTKESKKELFDKIKAAMPQNSPINDDEPPVQDATTNEWWDRNLKSLYSKFGLERV